MIYRNSFLAIALAIGPVGFTQDDQLVDLFDGKSRSSYEQNDGKTSSNNIDGMFVTTTPFTPKFSI